MNTGVFLVYFYIFLFIILYFYILPTGSRLIGFLFPTLIDFLFEKYSYMDYGIT